MTEIETRRYNADRGGYDVEGPCHECGTVVGYFVDEDGTRRDYRPSDAERKARREAGLAAARALMDIPDDVLRDVLALRPDLRRRLDAVLPR